MISLPIPRSPATDAATANEPPPQWERETPLKRSWDPARRVLASIRRYQRATQSGSCFRHAVRAAAVAQHRFWSAVAGCDIPLNCRLGGGLLLPHPNGVVIHPDTQVGPNCLLFQQVTLGSGGPLPGAPVLGAGVDVGSGAKILGGVTVEKGARIGANAVVLDHVPAGATAVGIPARIINTPGTTASHQPR